MNQRGPLLSIRDLRTYFRTDNGLVKAVDGVSLEVAAGETLGIVGESGSGKTVTCLSAMRLIPTPPGTFPSGDIHFDGQNLLAMNETQLGKIRGNRISMIFQDPMTALNPFLTLERQLTEVLCLHENLSRTEAVDKAIEMLERVGIPDAGSRIWQYPHQFSGGMRQRVMIAMALLCKPELLIADEPTTALDVTIQAQILELIRDLNRSLGTSVILITHDLGVVAGLADRVVVMYAGRIVEEGPTSDVFASPRHPYTRGLMQSIPRLDEQLRGRLESIAGLPPDLSRLPSGCPFHPRCNLTMDCCREEYPAVRELSAVHRAACWDIETDMNK